MALGNANTSAQARGKNKPVIVKRRREIVAAKGFQRITGSVPQRSAACALPIRAVSITYYHDGARQVPVVGDRVYSIPRDNLRYIVAAAHYKIGPIVRAYYNIEVDARGQITAITAC